MDLLVYATLAFSGIICVLIAIQDFRTREILALLPLLLSMSGVLFRGVQWDWFWIQEWILNLLMMGIMIGVSWLVMRLRGHRRFFDEVFGWGDVVKLNTSLSGNGLTTFQSLEGTQAYSPWTMMRYALASNL